MFSPFERDDWKQCKLYRHQKRFKKSLVGGKRASEAILGPFFICRNIVRLLLEQIMLVKKEQNLDHDEHDDRDFECQ